MPLLQASEYDASYFDGKEQAMSHNAGYSNYRRWFRVRGENSLGEYWKDYANDLKIKYNLAGKKVLEIGCAKGFVVKSLRDLGVDAYGLDVSQYAIDNAEEGMGPYLTIGDARTELSKYRAKEFDAVFSLRTLECFSNTELPNIIAEINRISRFQFHVVDEFTGEKQGAGQYYNGKILNEWLNLDFSKGTVLIKQENRQQFLTK